MLAWAGEAARPLVSYQGAIDSLGPRADPAAVRGCQFVGFDDWDELVVDGVVQVGRRGGEPPAEG
jgi:hypothetical protein